MLNVMSTILSSAQLPFCSAQLKQLKAEADQAARLDSAAKAVLREAQRAARQGRSLTAAELSSIRTPILNPPTAEEFEAERKAAERKAAEEARIIHPTHALLDSSTIVCAARTFKT